MLLRSQGQRRSLKGSVNDFEEGLKIVFTCKTKPYGALVIERGLNVAK